MEIQERKSSFKTIVTKKLENMDLTGYNVISFRFRLPNGKRLKKDFNNEMSIQDIHNYISI